jgi:alanine-synthesizing transaminase
MHWWMKATKSSFLYPPIRCIRPSSLRLVQKRRYYRTDPKRNWQPDVDHLRSLVTPRTRVLVTIDPNNPTGAVYSPSVRRALLDIAEEHGLTILADEVYGELGFDGPVPLLGTLDRDAAVISLSSLSKAYLARDGAPAGWCWARRHV